MNARVSSESCDYTMKWLLFTLLLLAAAARAQSPAGDPDAIDFSAKMDSIGVVGSNQPLNAGLLNQDVFQDIYFPQADDYPSLLHYGGPFIFDRTLHPNILNVLKQLVDLTGTGRKDIIDDWPRIHKRLSDYPYFDSIGTTILTVSGGEPTVMPIGAIDCNGDGITDIVAGANTDNGIKSGIVIYYGSAKIADSNYEYPDDSLPHTGLGGGRGIALGTFSRHGKPMLFMGGKDWTDSTHTKVILQIRVLRHLDNLAHDTVVILSQTTNFAYNGGDSMIAVTGMYATDITGDGITDLLVSDGARIYIFKGSDSLGYYPLTKDRAYYSIPSPRILDFDKYGDVDHFGEYMHACGDLTGSGIPYLMVLGEPDVTNFSLHRNAFFYAGGPALDSLYDAVASFDNYNGFTMDTLHNIEAGGHTAVVLIDNGDYWMPNGESVDFLLHKGTDKIPHTLNPRFLVTPTQPIIENALSIIEGRNYVKLEAELAHSERSAVSIYNVLGQQVLSKEELLGAGANTIYSSTAGWPSGTYIAVVRTESGVVSQKFIIDH